MNDQIKNEKKSFEKEIKAVKNQMSKLKFHEDSHTKKLENITNEIENTKSSCFVHQKNIAEEYVIKYSKLGKLLFFCCCIY